MEKTERFSLQEKSTERGVLEEGNEEDALIEKSAREQSALHFEARAHGADSAAAIPAASALEPFPVERRFVTEPGETGELRGEVDDFPGGSNKSPRGIRESIGEVDDVSFWEESGAVSKLAEYHPGLDGKPSDHEAAEGERPVRARAFDGSALSSNARVDSWLARRMAVRDPLLASETGGPPEPGDSAETPDSGGFPCEGADCASEGATQTEPQLISEERTLQRATVERLNRAPSGDLITWDDEKPEAPGEESPVGKGTVFPEAARNESPKVPAIPPPRTLE